VLFFASQNLCPFQAEKDLSPNARALWLKALSAVELRNYGYSISLIQAVRRNSPHSSMRAGLLRKAEVTSTKGKRVFLSGLSTASLKGASVVKKDPVAAMELAEKKSRGDPPYSPQANNLLKDARQGTAGFPEIAAFALRDDHRGKSEGHEIDAHELGSITLDGPVPIKAVTIYSKSRR